MSDIVISEFMDQLAIDTILRGRDVLYDPKLVDDKDRLYAALADCRALIVAIEPKCALRCSMPRHDCKSSDVWASVWITSMSMLAQPAKFLSGLPAAPMTCRWRSM